MGFMAGFGEGFSDSFERAAERRARREDDILRMNFQLVSDRQTEWDKYKREKSAQVKQAKAIAEMSGKGQGIWPKVYEWLDGDISAESALKMAQKGSFKIDTPQSPAETAQPDQVGNSGNTNPVDEQMTSALGGDAGQPQPAPASSPVALEASKNEGLFNSFFGAKNKGRLFGGSNERAQSRAVQQIAEQTGRPVEEVQSMISGSGTPEVDVPSSAGISYTAPVDNSVENIPTAATVRSKLNEAKRLGDKSGIEYWGALDQAHAEISNRDAMQKNPQGTRMVIVPDPENEGSVRAIAATQTENGWMTPSGELLDGNPTILSDADVKRRQEIMDNKDAQDLRVRQGNTVSVMRDGQELIDLIDQDEGILTSVADVATIIRRLGKEVEAAVNLVENGQGNPQAFATLDAAEENINNQIAQTPIADTATRAQLFDAKATLLVYKVGAAMGQSARSMSNNDYQKISEGLVNSSDGDTFKKNVISYIKSLSSDIDNQVAQFNEFNPAVEDFERNFGKGSIPPIVRKMQDFIAGTTDPLVQKMNQSLTSKTQQIIDNQSPKGEDLPIMTSPAEAAKLPPGTRFKTPDGRIKIVPGGKKEGL